MQLKASRVLSLQAKDSLEESRKMHQTSRDGTMLVCVSTSPLGDAGKGGETACSPE